MTVTRKEEVDRVIGAFKAMVNKRRKDIIRTQEKQAAQAAKDAKAAEATAQ